MIEVLRTGPLLTVQDQGRHGWASVGVPRSGAFDRAAARLANRLVGNADDAAVLEATFGGFVVRALDPVTVALTGAPCAGADFGVAHTLARGAGLALAAPPAGLRSYLAVRGGIAIAAVLGSRSTDLLSGLGPARLAAGDRLAVGSSVIGPPSGAVAIVRSSARPLRTRLAPRADWFDERAPAVFATAAWTVRADSDRIGVRLDGPALPRVRTGELPSEPTLPGSVQVPPAGGPIVLGPDAPVTGGYPVLAVVEDADLDLLAQLRPGDTARFTLT